MQFYSQLDSRWRNDIMTFCPTKWTDYIWRWGCLVTCLANIFQFFYRKEFTPKELNKKIIELKAYKYLDNSDTPVSEASVLLWKKLIEFYKEFSFVLFMESKDYSENSKEKYIACIIHEKTNYPHFINVIDYYDGIFWCFDVESGLLKSYNQIEIVNLHKIIYTGGN